QRGHAPSVTGGGHRPATTGTRACRAAAARLLRAFPGGELTCRQALEERSGGRGLPFHRPEPPTRLGRVDGDQLDHRRLATGNDDLLARARLCDEPGKVRLRRVDRDDPSHRVTLANCAAPSKPPHIHPRWWSHVFTTCVSAT